MFTANVREQQEFPKLKFQVHRIFIRYENCRKACIADISKHSRVNREWHARRVFGKLQGKHLSCHSRTGIPWISLVPVSFSSFFDVSRNVLISA